MSWFQSTTHNDKEVLVQLLSKAVSLNPELLERYKLHAYQSYYFYGDSISEEDFNQQQRLMREALDIID